MPADTLGDTALNGGKSPHFSIRIDKNMNSEMTYATLAHEWAHCLAWSVGQQTIDDHGAEWGIAYAKVYCAIYDTT
jgi:predicted SprT family Zn-dependent metalloprotease